LFTSLMYIDNVSNYYKAPVPSDILGIKIKVTILM